LLQQVLHSTLLGLLQAVLQAEELAEEVLVGAQEQIHQVKEVEEDGKNNK
jgi:hypothetical protein